MTANKVWLFVKARRCSYGWAVNQFNLQPM